MEIETQVRWVKNPEELFWVNDQYKKVDFVVSKWVVDQVAIALIKGEKAGVGRLVPLEDGSYELGGILVLPSYRNQGVAKKIVSFLVESAPYSKSIYCLPFEYLKPFYESFGFKVIHQDFKTPEDVRKKHSWCLENYSQNVLFMVKSSKQTS